jgi:hypothetical protein
MPRRQRRCRARQSIVQRSGVRGLRFEPLERREMLAADFGDAASSSGSSYASASHEAVGPMLGVLRDANPLVTNSLANGDAQDEDGVVFGFLRAGQAGSMTVYVTNAPSGARLDAWIDFARDSNFADPFDQIVDNLAVVEGDNVVTFNIPATVAGGYYYARVRLSTAGNLAYAGVAADGEVEDYLIPIAHADSGPFAGPQPVSAVAASQAVPTDIDSDGDLDLLTNRLSWIENINGVYGTEIQIANLTSPAVAPADIDGDGDMDFFQTGNGTRWYENNGGQSFTARTITSASHTNLSAVDLDGDGRLDLLAFTTALATWYRNDGNQAFTFTPLPSSVNLGRMLGPVDMDADGDVDLLTVESSSPYSLQWHENDGSENFTMRPVSPAGANLRTATVADLDRDGDQDIVAAYNGSGGVRWYENDGAFAFTSHLLDATAWAAESATVGDLDGDGDLDIAASGLNRIGWYENDGDEQFAFHAIAASIGTRLGIAAGDVDSDGRLDLITAAGSSTTALISWYRQVAEYDYGDAPHPYKVHLQENGARHNAVGPTLGTLRDAETDGAHSPAGAEAEDDGVTFGVITPGATHGTVTVNVQNASAGARLDAWIDFNGDGTWGGGEEQIFTSRAVVEGSSTLTFAIPSWAVPGATYARIRLSTAGGLGVNGAALDGEVEDHPLTLPARQPATGLFETSHPIPASPDGFLVTADVDGDGDSDVITGRFGFVAGISWQENLGAAGFATHNIPNSAINSEDFAADDLDGDGDVDIIAFGASQLVWLENDGQGNFTRRVQSLVVPFGSFGTPVALDIADIDGDGDQDVLAAHLGNGVYVLLNNGQQQFTVRPVDPPPGGSSASVSGTSIVAADVDQDGDLDIVAGGAIASFGSPASNVNWYQNNGGLTFTARTVKTRPTSPLSVYTETVAVGDMDGDGDLDIVAGGTPGHTPGVGAATVTWHEQVADNQWLQHDIDSGGTVRWVELADFDADGDLDIATVGWSSPTVVYHNAGSGRFHRRQLTSINGGWSVAAADMDGDGDLDVVTPLVSGGGAAWFENVDLVDPDYGDAPAPYPTTRVNDGPVHNGGGPRLGAARDSEADGAPTSNADGDAGDDGVTLPAIQAGQASGTLIVNVQNAPAGAKLDAWVDFNGDGSFDGAGEQIFASRTVVEGDNVLTFNIPAHTPAGAAVARFRLSTAGGLLPHGAAFDGEVEDYLLVIAPPHDATAEYAAPRSVNPAVELIRVADIDGDGDADFLTVGGGGPNLLWHENLGDGVFLRHRRGFENSGSSWGARPIDFDRDGDVDFVVTNSTGLGWYENNGAESFTYRFNTGSVTGLRTVFDVADIDNDGDLDVIVSRNTSSTSQIYLLRNNGAQGFSFGSALTTPPLEPAAIRAADVDRDGDIDFAVTFVGDGAGWYENQGSTWTYREVTNPAEQDRAGRDVVPIDFDEDGDIDLMVLAYVQSNLVLDLYRNDGDQSFARETLASTPTNHEFNWVVRGADRLQVADLDGDGDLDAAASTYVGVRAYRNDGPGPLTQLIATTSTTYVLTMPLAVADLDADGRLEILSSHQYPGTFWLDDLPFGDYNRDGTVDPADRDLYEATLGQTVTPPGARLSPHRLRPERIHQRQRLPLVAAASRRHRQRLRHGF